ncbi:hypothetical protein PTTG_06813 [Puccinia triticina 1-1 BBBD Race 1]|uniref:CxC1 domain-containing protein n=1 Tax=Puccinia triticina (isolate 1-1 / race 1 (BBBD)) TaxID=630390 RepID=A0A180G2B0_PUCT1|nr:hypothetical protein PTTG_06813 [Puccinia triticina 1-1 BBBD Race 1]
MAKRRMTLRVPVKRGDVLRRLTNHDRDTGALRRLRGHEAAVRQAEDPTANFYDRLGDTESFENYEQQSLGKEEEEDDWMNLLPPEEPDEIDKAIQSNLERLRQEALQVNWDSLLDSLHATYMTQKMRTKNWTTTKSYDTFNSCECVPQRRTIDLIDVYGQRREDFAFCSCTGDAIRLLQSGYLPGLPIRPVTAFSLPLLILHNSLWNHCNVGALPFMNALQEYLEPRSQRLKVQNSNHVCHFSSILLVNYENLSQLLWIFIRELEDRTARLMFSALRLTPQQILACQSCPACFGPEPSNRKVYPSSTKNRLIICLDGNFQHRHHAKASRDYDRIQTPNIFLPPSDVHKMTAKIRELERQKKPDDKKDRCTESHKAADDKQNQSTWKGCDDTGLMGCCCRHDNAIYMANISKSGEQRCFPLALIDRVLNDIEPDRPVGILYDIGCSLDKYMRIRNLMKEHRPRIQFATSVFHSYVHEWFCQVDYNPRLNTGWGMLDGEGLERMWSFLSRLIGPLRYSTRNHRLGSLAHLLKHHNSRSIINCLPRWLKRKFNNAIKRRRLVLKDLSELLQKRNPYSSSGRCYTRRFFRKQWEHQRKFKNESTADQEDRNEKLVSLCKRESAIEAMRKRLSESYQYFTDAEEVNKIFDKIRSEAEKLEQEWVDLTEGGHPAPDTYVEARTMGRHLGTKLQQKILKAIQGRRAAVNKLIATFNTTFEKYITKYPQQRVADQSSYPLTYEAFSKMPLDDKFWNDGLYYRSDAPWAIDSDVQSGIHGVLLLDRIQEEFELIAQELFRAMAWALALYDHLRNYITYIRTRANQLQEGESDVELDHIDGLDLGNCPREEKLRLINRELQSLLYDHGLLIQDWSLDIAWLWNQCEKMENGDGGDLLNRWVALLDQIVVDQHIHTSRRATHQATGVVEILEEDAVLGVHVDDGEGGNIASQDPNVEERGNGAGTENGEEGWEDI